MTTTPEQAAELPAPRRRDLFGLAAGAAGVVAGSPARAETARLASLRERAKAMKIAALMVRRHGRSVFEFGEIRKPYLLHSMRKSMLSVLYGIGVDQGEIKLDATLGEMGIDDYTPLTDTEKRATVRHLLGARSGVYIPASAEAPTMKARRPARGSHPPGTFWYYNNWDFNVAGEVYTRFTGKGVFEAFDHKVAKPLGFQDFDAFRDGFYMYEAEAARFPAYHMQLSARDLMRLGVMLLDEGRWNGRQIVSRGWIEDSTRPISTTNYPDALNAYGYMWWLAGADAAKDGVIIPAGTFTAAGAGGHFLTVAPKLGLVSMAHVDTFDDAIQSPLANPATYGDFLRAVIAATD